MGIALLLLSACMSLQPITSFPNTISPTSTFTIAPTKTTTLTPVPTLSQEKAYRLMTDLLHDNNGCQLPCWWGLIPGEATHTDFYRKLIVFDSIDSGHYLNEFDPSSGEVHLYHIQDDLHIGISISTRLESDKNTLRLITISTQALYTSGNHDHMYAYGVSAYNELFDSYSLPKLLATYGRPTRVLVEVEKFDYRDRREHPERFEITILYPEKGIFVSYEMYGERNGEKISGCPAKAFVQLSLLSPNDQNSYEKVLPANDGAWKWKLAYAKSLEDATSMTIEQFYQTFKQPNHCLESPLSIWPDSS
jgi:hypothetical protein